MPKEPLTFSDNSNNLDSSDNSDPHLNSASSIQSQAHQEANTAVSKAMAVYWSWIAAGLLPATPKSVLEVETPKQKANPD
jgi:hypothetical protein